MIKRFDIVETYNELLSFDFSPYIGITDIRDLEILSKVQGIPEPKFVFTINKNKTLINVKRYNESIPYQVSISSIDLVLLLDLTLSIRPNNYTNYVSLYDNENLCSYPLHRYLLNFDAYYVDHIDGNGLNNDRSNLRAVTALENSQNRHCEPRAISGIRGVHWYEDRQKWGVNICINYKVKHLGLFISKEEAEIVAMAYRHKYMPFSECDK